MFYWVKDKYNISYALFIESKYKPEKTQFLTPDEYNQQIGFIVYLKDEKIRNHTHDFSIRKNLNGSSEVLIVRKGSCNILIYDKNQDLIASQKLELHDIIFLIQGSHAINFLEDSILLEVKQGPYLGIQEKIFI